APCGARRAPGSDAGLLRFEQGVGVPCRELAAAWRTGGARRGRAAARRRADVVPWPRRGHRSRWGTDASGDRRAGGGVGSRPAARGRHASDAAPEAPRIDELRAIPWVFAWSQSRIELPGWYGLGTALEAYRREHGEAGLERIGGLYRDWPFVTSLFDNAEL